MSSSVDSITVKGRRVTRAAADVALRVELSIMLCLGAPLPTLLAAGQQFTLFAA